MALCSTVGGSLSITVLGVVLGERHAPCALKTHFVDFAMEYMQFNR